MSKAIVGAVEIAGALALGAVALGTGGLGTAALAAYLNTTQGFSLMVGLAASGISAEAGAIASAISGGRGVNITDRRPASNRQIIAGTQMVGGVLVYESVTGHQYNQVIAIASHSIHSILGIYLDGRKVYFTGSGGGWSVRNGVGFGGNADGSDHLGPDGVTKFNFGGKVYVEARYGDQAFGDYISGLTANDSAWGPKGSDCPSGVGIAYLYLKCTAGDQFPNRPEVRILVNGKNDILDPRTGTTGFTNNAALVLADRIRDTTFGLGDSAINTAQLIAAANLCDEQVAVAALSGSTESRYCTDFVCDTGTSVSDAMETMRANMNARISYIGGEWWIMPGAYVSPVLSFGKEDLTGPVQWNPGRSVRELPNRVIATHISAEYPYSVFGGYYLNHSGVQNNFDLKFQQTSVPYYAQDVLHGYPTDQFLTEDLNHIRPLAMEFQAGLSVTQCQRLMKQALLGLRAKQGSGTLEMDLGAYKLQPGDTFKMTFDELGWNEEILEVTSTSLRLERSGEDNDEALSIRYTVGVRQTDPSIYAWSTLEELNVYAAAAAPTQTPYTPNPPTNMQLFSGPNTAITTSDGLLVATIEVTWDTPLDNLATSIQIQYAVASTGAWYGAPSQDISLNVSLISTVSAGASYDVRIRTVRASGAVSDWVQQNGFLVPALTGNLGTLAASLSTQGFVGKWWRIGSLPAVGSDPATGATFNTTSNTINYNLPVTGSTDYKQYANIQTLGTPADGGPLDPFYAKFTGSVVAPTTGSYTIGVNADDGARLTVNGTVLFDRLSIGNASPGDKIYVYSTAISLTAGTSYPVVLEYYNQTGSGCVQFLWTLPGASAPTLIDLGATYSSAGSVTYSNGSSVQSTQTTMYSGTTGNLIDNGDFLLQNIDGWSGGSYNAQYNAIIVPSGGDGVSSPTFGVLPGNKYRFTYKGWSIQDTQQTYLRVFYSGSYSPNLKDGYISYQDFLSAGAIAVNDTNASTYYDWTAPADARYAALAIYSLQSGTDLAFTHIVAQDYAAAAQWGADQTSSNTSNDTSNVSGVPSTVIANVIPTGYKLIINTGARSYEIQAV